MNCGSCIYKENDCEYESFRKSVESDIFHGDMMEIFKLTCSKYKCRQNNTKEELNQESYDVTKQGVLKKGKMYKTLSGSECLVRKYK